MIERSPRPGKPSVGSRVATGRGAALVAAYLLLTVPLLLPGGVTAARTGVLTLHLGGALALFALAPRGTGRSRVGTLADWAPLLLLPLLYAELPLLMEGLPGPVRYHDPALGRLRHCSSGDSPRSPGPEPGAHPS